MIPGIKVHLFSLLHSLILSVDASFKWIFQDQSEDYIKMPLTITTLQTKRQDEEDTQIQIHTFAG